MMLAFLGGSHASAWTWSTPDKMSNLAGPERPWPKMLGDVGAGQQRTAVRV
ncbi:hypothetical protein ACFQX6_66515 [Streptosporangium lutulentum]